MKPAATGTEYEVKLPAFSSYFWCAPISFRGRFSIKPAAGQPRVKNTALFGDCSKLVEVSHHFSDTHIL